MSIRLIPWCQRHRGISSPPRGRRARSWKLFLEILEGKYLPTTLTVVNTADSGDGSLRAAITQADPGDTIDFDPSLAGQAISLTTGGLTVNKDLTITGLDADQLTISGNERQPVFTTDAPDLLVISGLTITHGMNGVYNSGNLELDDDVITQNIAGTGGGVFNSDGGAMTLNDCVVSSNTAANAGGIQNQGVRVTLNNCQVVNNSAGPAAGGGGGIRNSFGLVNINDSVIANNSAYSEGGGIGNAGTITLTDSTVSDNTAHYLGGGIFNSDGGILNVVRSTIDGNTADIGGGGLYSTYQVTIRDSTIANNTAISTAMPTTGATTGGGGIVATRSAQITVANSTIAGNTTGWAGGGMEAVLTFGNFHSLTLFDTIVANNTAIDHGPDAAGVLVSQGHNLISIGDGASGFALSDRVGAGGQAIDPLLGPLQGNGGPTQTMALLPGSPAVDAGDNTQAPDFDQRGAGFDRIVGGTIDIGAYEAQIGQATSFVVHAPDIVSAGVPFVVTVTAWDAYEHIASGYTGTVTFSSTDSDPGVVLPADYTFTPDDAGMHTFMDTGRGETTLLTPGDQTLTTTDTADSSITGSATMTVSDTGAGLKQGLWNDVRVSAGAVDTDGRTAQPSPGVAPIDQLFAWIAQQDLECACSPGKHKGQGTTDAWAVEVLGGADWEKIT